MVKFKKIWFPLNVSEASPKIVPYVHSMADLFEAEVHLLYVARSMAYLSAIQLEAPTRYTFDSELFDKAEISLQPFKKKHFGNQNYYKTTVVLGYPSVEILSQDLTGACAGNQSAQSVVGPLSSNTKTIKSPLVK